MKMKKIYILIVLIFVVILTGVLIQQTTKITEEKTPQELCEFGGGIWREFSNSGEFCHDECNKPEQVICKRFMSMGCDCGPDKCWNRNSCVFE